MQFPGLILVQSELCSQINPTNFFIGGKTGGGAALENHAAMDDVGPISDAQGFSDVVVSYEHTYAAVAEVKNDLLDVRNRDGVDAGEGFIEQDELRRDDQCTRDLR